MEEPTSAAEDEAVDGPSRHEAPRRSYAEFLDLSLEFLSHMGAPSDERQASPQAEDARDAEPRVEPPPCLLAAGRVDSERRESEIMLLYHAEFDP